MLKHLTAIALLLTPAAAQSQEYPGCFMVNQQGETTFLTEICPQVATEKTKTTEELFLESADVYADAFCAARQKGMDWGRASVEGERMASDYLTLNGISREQWNSEWTRQKEAAAETLCPEWVRPSAQ